MKCCEVSFETCCLSFCRKSWRCDQRSNDQQSNTISIKKLTAVKRERERECQRGGKRHKNRKRERERGGEGRTEKEKERGREGERKKKRDGARETKTEKRRREREKNEDGNKYINRQKGRGTEKTYKEWVRTREKKK